MALKKLDKSQVPQFAGLCVLSAGAFGWFVVRLVTPSPAAAGTLAAAATPSAARASAARAAVQAGGKAAASVVPETEAVVPPPTPGMRDPFAVGIVDPKTSPMPVISPLKSGSLLLPGAPTAPAKPAKPIGTAMASIRELPSLPVAAPSAPGLPNATGLPAAPGLPGGFHSPGSVTAAPAAPPPVPAWSVTGVLQSDTEKIAILRNGEARRIVRTGDFVDGTYRVIDVSRTWVLLRHGTTWYKLLLGETKPALLTAPPAAPPAEPRLAPTEDASSADSGSAFAESLVRLIPRFL